jgi:hypothetical protein
MGLAASSIALSATACSNDTQPPSRQNSTVDGSLAAATTTATPSEQSREMEGAPSAAEVKLGRWTKIGPSLLARKTGMLTVRDGCLMIDNANGPATLPLFPYEATWDASTQTLSYSGSTYRVGDTITVGGGAISRESLAQYPGRKDVPECGQADLFLIG